MYEQYRSNNPLNNVSIQEAMDLAGKLALNGIVIDEITVQAQDGQFNIRYIPLPQVHALEPALTDTEPLHLLFRFAGRESHTSIGIWIHNLQSGWFSEAYYMYLILDQIRKGV